MKTLVIASAAGAFLSLAAMGGVASAASYDGMSVAPVEAAPQVQVAHGWHPTCEYGPRGYWHRHGPILGVPLLCLPPAGPQG